MADRPKHIIFESIGEMSKDIMGTAVVAAISRAYPDIPIVVTTLHMDIWLHNPHVYRVYKADALSYFYDEYMAEGTSKVFKFDPYNSSEFMAGDTHLIDAWCSLCGVERGDAQPQLFFTQRELEVTRKLVASDKPLFLFQPFGENGGMPYPISWSRDIPDDIAQSIADKMTEKGYRVIQISNSPKMLARNADPLALSNRLLMCAISLTSKRLFVDSFLQHAAAALGTPSVVAWNMLSPEQQGYSIHTNIVPRNTPEFLHLKDTYIHQFRIAHTMPQPVPMIISANFHDAAAILKALDIS